MDHDRLVRSARAGDADAFTELVRRYQAMVFGSAYARVGDFHLAEDIAQQAFLAAWRSLPTLNDPARFGGWLLRAYLTQPFHVADEFTGRRGEDVLPDEAARDARAACRRPRRPDAG